MALEANEHAEIVARVRRATQVAWSPARTERLIATARSELATRKLRFSPVLVPAVALLLLTSLAAAAISGALPLRFGARNEDTAPPRAAGAARAVSPEVRDGAAAPAASPPAEQGVPPSEPAPRTAPAAPASSALASPASATAQRANWRELARAGRFKDAFEQLDGAAASDVAQSAEDLLLAADAARLSHHPHQARRWLELLLQRYPNDSRVPVASFTLGRLLADQLGNPRLAARAFQRVAQSGGALAPDALAREAEAWAAAGAHDAARGCAKRYLERYPNGEHASAMRAIE
jgi:TolA-binding protein